MLGYVLKIILLFAYIYIHLYICACADAVLMSLVHEFHLDYVSVKGTTAIDFRADNDKNLTSLENNSLDLYSSLKSVYLQDRENKIKNSIEDNDEWGSLDN